MDKVESEAPVASEAPETEAVAPATPQPTDAAPNTDKPARKWDPANPSIDDLRAFGLTYLGGGTVAGSDGRMLPAADLEPGIAASYVKDRATMLAVLATKYYGINYPPAEKE